MLDQNDLNCSHVDLRSSGRSGAEPVIRCYDLVFFVAIEQLLYIGIRTDQPADYECSHKKIQI